MTNRSPNRNPSPYPNPNPEPNLAAAGLALLCARRVAAGAAGEGCGCDVPATRPAATWGGPDADARSLGRRLRDAVLTDVAGEAVQLGTYLGGAADDATIVVFLRHLA